MSPPTTRISALVVEDDPIAARALGDALATAPQIEIIATASTFERACAIVSDPLGRPFDLALVDLHLPDGSGIEVISRLREQRQEVAAVVLTVFEDPETVVAAIMAGARGYLLKGWTTPQLLECVFAAAAGGAPMSPRVARYVLEHLQAGGDPKATTPPSRLTLREREVLSLLCEGYTYREVAKATGVALGTVQTHVKSIYRKLEVASKAELTATAFRRGLIT